MYAFSFLFTREIDLFEAKNFYSNNGFVLAFTESMQYINPVDEPAEYNEATMNEIAKKIESSVKEENGVKPNIIVLMSESFWDITRVKELGLRKKCSQHIEIFKRHLLQENFLQMCTMEVL